MSDNQFVADKASTQYDKSELPDDWIKKIKDGKYKADDY